MGRKSSSRNNDGGGGGGGGGGAATVMGLRMIQCGRQTVHVIQPDGQVRQFVVPVRVSDLLQLYPHNFVSHAAPGTTATGGDGGNPLLEGGAVTAGAVKRTSGILPHDAYLETGSIYVLLPLPRLFPSSPPATPHFCSCFFAAAGRAEEGLGIGGAIKAELKRHLPSVVGGGGGAASSSSKISPEDNGGVSGSYSTSSSSSSSSIPLPRRLWEPPLEIISEDKVLVINPIPSPTTTTTSTSSSTTYARHDDETATEKKENQNKGKKLVAAALNNLKLRLEEKKTSTHQAASEKSKNPVLVSPKTEEGRS